MAPPPKTEEDKFLEDLAAFHERRGTPLDRDPKVSGRPVRLFDLYNTVLREGGYDALSAERMRWRQLAKDFGLGHHHEAAMTFQLKTAYYKYLTAYEIKSHWGEEPPPPEILENLTAKGGDVRKRTLENFNIPTPRDPGPVADGVDLADAEQKNGRLGNAVGAEDLGSGGKSSIRQLRQDPKRTQLFQPEVGSTRRAFSRATNSPQASPTPAQHHQPQPQHPQNSEPRNVHFTIDRYQPRQPVAMALRPVVTPGTNPELFRQREFSVLKAGITTKPVLELQQALKDVLAVNMRGPNIYIRCLYGLRSEIIDEQDFALHHLVKVSFERGDRYKFEGFPQLAESLLEKALEISTLIHGIKWTISYEENTVIHNGDVLNGSFGTKGLYQKLQEAPLLAEEHSLEPAEFCPRLVKLNETALVIRNMIMLEENALFISKSPLLRDFLIIAFTLPQQGRLTEFRQYALEIAEQTTKFWELGSNDPIYQSLVNHLSSEDRGAILSSARALTRIGMDSPRPNRLTDLPLLIVQKLISFLFLDSDDELMLTSLDLLYQYTALPENLGFLLTSEPSTLHRLTLRLVPLILHNASAHEQKIKVKDVQKSSTINKIPVVPDDLYSELLAYSEPDRSNRWLRCCFEEASNEDITQIAIWQAYQGRFQGNHPIPAAEFIKNVSGTFTTAQAQVINGPNPRFIIKGIRPKRVVVSLKGEPYHQCLWLENTATRQSIYASQNPSEPPLCGRWYSAPRTLWEHLVREHLNIPQTHHCRFDGSVHSSYRCRWIGCNKHEDEPETNARAAGLHLRLHVNDRSNTTKSDTLSARTSDITKAAEWVSHTFYTTVVDEKGAPAGIPYMATLLLKNLARHALRADKNEDVSGPSLMDNLFSEVKDQLWTTFTLHRTLRGELDHLISMIYKTGDGGSGDGNRQGMGDYPLL